MHEIGLRIIAYLRDTWRFRWYGVLAASVIVLIGWPLVMQLPDRYKSSARIRVDTESLLQPLLRGLTIDLNMGQRLRMMTRTLFSRANLEKIARMTDMDLSAQTPREMKALTGKLKQGIKLRGDPRGPNLYTISYESANPQLAKEVVQAVVTLFIENALSEAHQNRDMVFTFLNRQIEEYERQIRATEAKIMEIKREYKGAIPGDVGNYFQHLEATKGRLQATRIKLGALEKQRDALARQIQNQRLAADSDSKQPATAGAGAIDRLGGRINALQAKLNNLLLKYTQWHPEVVAIKESLDSLRQQAQALLGEEGYEGGGDEGTLAVTPMNQQQLGIALAETEGKIAFQKARIAALEKEINRINTLIETMPEVILKLSELHRAYVLDKKNYRALLERRETAIMTQKVERSTNSVKFRVIDPPTVPYEPSSPNRPRLLTLVLLMGLGAGGGLAFLLSQLRPTVATRGDLKELTEVPVLGSISVVWTRSSLRKRRLRFAAFLLSVGLLVVTYGLMLGLDRFNINMMNYLWPAS